MSNTPDVEHFYSGDKVLQLSWDLETKAIKVIPSENTQFSIELNAQDGDSVLAVADCVTLSLHDTPIDCKNMRRCRLYGTAEVLVSPLEEGDLFYPLNIDVRIVEICAKRVKLIISEGQTAHLVLQS